MKQLAPLLLLLFTAVAVGQEPAAPAPASQQPTRVRFETTMGNFVVRFDATRAPLTVENFIRYVREGQYEGVIFHRVIANFLVQGGGYDANYQLKPVHGYVVNESGNGLMNRRGTIGMARAEGPHTSTCQFFINLADNPDLNPLPTRWGYAVFGDVVEGMDVVDRIGNSATGAVGPFKENAPLKPVVIQKAVLLE
ncbi:MAG TPA: peptidylprolyl isomerase [Steroidobacteraceae bacterium]|jgi:cyclophilin family peptidyl-prolyl cis-trans isomerase|nr:peptidylprolyl isomerase [Steroidobacteraceae bacterium]